MGPLESNARGGRDDDDGQLDRQVQMCRPTAIHATKALTLRCERSMLAQYLRRTGSTNAAVDSGEQCCWRPMAKRYDANPYVAKKSQRLTATNIHAILHK